MTDNITLRDVIESDIPLFHTFEQDPIAGEMAAFPARDWEMFSRHWTKLLSNDEIGKKTILLDGEIVGNVVSWGAPDGREVGYWIDRAHWGKGIATAALSRYLALEQTRPLYAHVAKHNAGSIRVLQKCGFVMMGSEIPHVELGEDGIEEVTLILTFVASHPE